MCGGENIEDGNKFIYFFQTERPRFSIMIRKAKDITAGYRGKSGGEFLQNVSDKIHWKVFSLSCTKQIGSFL